MHKKKVGKSDDLVKVPRVALDYFFLTEPGEKAETSEEVNEADVTEELHERIEPASGGSTDAGPAGDGSTVARPRVDRRVGVMIVMKDEGTGENTLES